MSRATTGSTSGVGPIDGGPLTAIAGIGLLINVAGLYAFTGVALCVFGYIVLTLILSSRAERSARIAGSANAGTAVLILSWVVALVGGVLVGAFHWVQYAHAAYAVLSLYAVAVLIWLMGRAFSVWWSWLFPALGLALLTAVMGLGAPPGADDMEKQESWTPVNVTAVDPAGKPIEGASVYLDLVSFWRGDPKLDGDREWWSKGTTDGTGQAHLQLHEDPRFKRLVVRVQCEPFTGGYNEPTTISSYVGYVDARLQTTLPQPKLPYSFQVVMTQRAHPDSAFLAIEIKAPVSPQDIVTRSIRLAVTTEPELARSAERHTIQGAALANSGCVRDLYLSGTQRLVFKLGRDLAARPLTLHVLEHDWARYDDTYLELRKVNIAAISLGEERILEPIALSGRGGDSDSPAIAEPAGRTDRR